MGNSLYIDQIEVFTFPGSTSSIYIFFFCILPSNNCDKLLSETKKIRETVFSLNKTNSQINSNKQKVRFNETFQFYRVLFLEFSSFSCLSSRCIGCIFNWKWFRLSWHWGEPNVNVKRKTTYRRMLSSCLCLHYSYAHAHTHRHQY